MPVNKCKGLCESQDFRNQFIATKSEYPEGYYAYGCGRCTACEIFIIPDIKNCPCCNRKIKSRPILTKDRVKYIEYQFVRY